MANHNNAAPREALTFDDVLIRPGLSEVMPGDVDIRSYITRSIPVNLPIMASAMDTVTEAAMAIAMAQAGGIGVIHRNLDPADQAAQVRQVKKFESGMVVNPLTIEPTATLQDALALMKENRISGIPVVENASVGAPGKLVGILTNRDVRFATDPRQRVAELMTKDKLITVREGVSQEEAKKLLHQHRIEKLLVVDDQYRCVGLITVKDIEKAVANPERLQGRAGPAARRRRHHGGRQGLRAHRGAGRCRRRSGRGRHRARPFASRAGSGHAASRSCPMRCRWSPATSPPGKAPSADRFRRRLASRSASARARSAPRASSPASACRSSPRSWTASRQPRRAGTPVIADGGIKFSGDLAKALAAGADVAMVGSLLAGTDETPGEVFLYQGRSYKSYRGMGSVAAMARGSADRYFQQDIKDALKLVPEGVEGQVGYKGPVANVLHQLAGGLRAAMGYAGAKTLGRLPREGASSCASRAPACAKATSMT